MLYFEPQPQRGWLLLALDSVITPRGAEGTMWDASGSAPGWLHAKQDHSLLCYPSSATVEILKNNLWKMLYVFVNKRRI